MVQWKWWETREGFYFQIKGKRKLFVHETYSKSHQNAYFKYFEHRHSEKINWSPSVVSMPSLAFVIYSPHNKLRFGWFKLDEKGWEKVVKIVQHLWQ